jgi:hypothetical protein
MVADRQKDGPATEVTRQNLARPARSRYNAHSIALSSRERIAPSLPLSEITKRTCPCVEVVV